MVKSNTVLTILVTILLVLFVIYYVIPTIAPPATPTAEYSQTAPIKLNVMQLYNDTGHMPALDTASYKLYKAGVLMESGAAASGVVTTTGAYTSGDVLSFELSCSGYETTTAARSVLFYETSEIPSYHYLSAISVPLSPSVGFRTYVNGVQNTTASENITATNVDIVIEFFTNTDDGAVGSYYDYVYSIVRDWVIVVRTDMEGTETPADLSFSGITWNVQAPTTSQDGYAVYTIDSLYLDAKSIGSDVRKNFQISFSVVNNVVGDAEDYVDFMVEIYSESNANYYQTYSNHPTGADAESAMIDVLRFS